MLSRMRSKSAWEQYSNGPDGKAYYYNPITGETSWDKPGGARGARARPKLASVCEMEPVANSDRSVR